MIYEGQAIKVLPLEKGMVEIRIDLVEASVNKFSQSVLADLGQALEAIQVRSDVRGVLLSSGKPDVFVVGADITEFVDFFQRPDEELIEANMAVNQLFNALEDLPVPTVVAINGLALGGGFEICLACDFRIMSREAEVGLPETKLGIYPGWGGTVRLPRLIGVDGAVEWIATGQQQRAEEALRVGAVDGVVSPSNLREAALETLSQAMAGELDFLSRRQPKLQPLQLSPIEQVMAFESCKAVVGAKAGPHYPAPLAAIKAMQKAAGQARDAALAIEAKGFAALAKSAVAANLVGLFLNDQLLKKKAKAYGDKAQPVARSAVLGAGIMGGGIAYQSALKGTPVLLKDIQDGALQLGMQEASKLLDKQVERGRLARSKAREILASIRPTLGYGEINRVDMVIEAVVENPKIKQLVLHEVEALVRPGTVLASNTSTISINQLAQLLKFPQNFCGMHFFNPVHIMPLVEVIRGEKTSEAAVATTVAYARAMGKTPIVVNDCPGFLVNRVLFPYLAAFTNLVGSGVDFQRIDTLMEGFGWPMGPAYLLDVVGIDTAQHARQVMAEGFPERMTAARPTAIDALVLAGRLGKKNGKGFYLHEVDNKGKSKKLPDASVQELLGDVCYTQRTVSDEEIITMMMLPLCLEAVRCLEDGIVESAAEVDMGLVYGIGFPPFRGGALRYIDALGVAKFVALADSLADELGPLYQPTAQLREMATSGLRFYP